MLFQQEFSCYEFQTSVKQANYNQSQFIISQPFTDYNSQKAQVDLGYYVDDAQPSTDSTSEISNDTNFQEQEFRQGSFAYSNQYPQKNLKKSAADEEKFKTELCKNWSETGHCNYGKKCKFAHGKSELVDKQTIQKCYRSKVCHKYNNYGFCPYGQRCTFLHYARNLDVIKQQFYYSSLLWGQSQFQQPMTNNKSRLSIFVDLTSWKSVHNFNERKINELAGEQEQTSPSACNQFFQLPEQTIHKKLKKNQPQNQKTTHHKQRNGFDLNLVNGNPGIVSDPNSAIDMLDQNSIINILKHSNLTMNNFLAQCNNDQSYYSDNQLQNLP